MFFTIYKTTNTLTGKYYIGKHQTSKVDDNYLGSGKHLKRAIAKYGKQNFKKEILFVFETEEEMDSMEIELLTEDVLNDPLSYNMKEGGTGSWKYIHNNGELYYPKRNKKLAEVISNLHQTGKLTHHQLSTEKAIENRKISFSKIKHQQGTKNSQYGTCWITNGIENKKIRKEDIDKWFSLGYYKGRI